LPTRYTISQVYFDKELYVFPTDLLSIVGSLNTVYTLIGICHASYTDWLLVRSEWNSIPSWSCKNPTSESWWVHPWTLLVTAPNCKCCWNYTSAGTTYIYIYIYIYIHTDCHVQNILVSLIFCYEQYVCLLIIHVS